MKVLLKCITQKMNSICVQSHAGSLQMLEFCFDCFRFPHSMQLQPLSESYFSQTIQLRVVNSNVTVNVCAGKYCSGGKHVKKKSRTLQKNNKKLSYNWIIDLCIFFKTNKWEKTEANKKNKNLIFESNKTTNIHWERKRNRKQHI